MSTALAAKNAWGAPILPGPQHVEKRLEQILRRGSLNVGGNATMDRLMLMMTRSCDLRCSYCMVSLTEEAWNDDHPGHAGQGRYRPDGIPFGDMSTDTLHRAVDMLMRSVKPQLGIQLFGGEPARRWDALKDALEYAWTHPARKERPIEFLFTTNGVNLNPERLAQLKHLPVVVQFSLDGDERGSRFRRGHLMAHDAAVDRMMEAVTALKASGLRWFMNATLPPAAAGEVLDRYRWAREHGVPALQINYATGMMWNDDQIAAYLTGVQEMLADHHHNPAGLELFNWRNDADPVPLCGDVVVDVDGDVFQVGALFHEKRFPILRAAYRRYNLDDMPPFTGMRMTLIQLWANTQAALAHEPKDLATFKQNIELGAAVDLVVQFTKKRLGRKD